MNSTLKPCPFCGGEAERVDIEDGENTGGSCVQCTQCFASSNVEFGFKEHFITNWNRRVFSILYDRIEKLECELKRIRNHQRRNRQKQGRPNL